MFKNHGSSYKCVEKVRYLRPAVCRVQFFFQNTTILSFWYLSFRQKVHDIKICLDDLLSNLNVKYLYEKNKRASRLLKKLRTSSLGLLIVTIFIKQKLLP